jgi:dolichol-phosphate mannosyltransferase
MTSFFLRRRECIDGILFQPSGFKLLLEILVRGRVLPVEEIPFVFSTRNHGVSRASFRGGWDYAKLLAWLYAERLRTQQFKVEF